MTTPLAVGTYVRLKPHVSQHYDEGRRVTYVVEQDAPGLGVRIRGVVSGVTVIAPQDWLEPTEDRGTMPPPGDAPGGDELDEDLAGFARQMSERIRQLKKRHKLDLELVEATMKSWLTQLDAAMGIHQRNPSFDATLANVRHAVAGGDAEERAREAARAAELKLKRELAEALDYNDRVPWPELVDLAKRYRETCHERNRATAALKTQLARAADLTTYALDIQRTGGVLLTGHEVAIVRAAAKSVRRDAPARGEFDIEQLCNAIKMFAAAAVGNYQAITDDDWKMLVEKLEWLGVMRRAGE